MDSSPPTPGGRGERILRQKAVEKGGAAAGQPRDEKRPPDGGGHDFRMAFPVFHQTEPVTQETHKVAVYATRADRFRAASVAKDWRRILGVGGTTPRQNHQGRSAWRLAPRRNLSSNRTKEEPSLSKQQPVALTSRNSLERRGWPVGALTSPVVYFPTYYP